MYDIGETRLEEVAFVDRDYFHFPPNVTEDFAR